MNCLSRAQGLEALGKNNAGCGQDVIWEGDAMGQYSGCIENRASTRCGPFLITENQFNQCKELTALPFDDYVTCAWNGACVRACLKAYLGEYVMSCNKLEKPEDVTCAHFAKVLYSGKDRCDKSKKNKGFANAVNACMKANK